MVSIWATSDADPGNERDYEMEGEIWAIQNMPFYLDHITVQRSGNPAYKWDTVLAFIDRRIDLDDFKDDLREKRLLNQKE